MTDYFDDQHDPLRPDARRGAADARPVLLRAAALARLAQGTSSLRPVAVDPGATVRAWEVRAGAQRRLFLINTGSGPVTVDVQTPGTGADPTRSSGRRRRRLRPWSGR